MRPILISTLAFASVLALPALAEEPTKQAPAPKTHCTVTAKEGSRAVQGENLVLKAGETVKDAVAVDGDVVVRKGAVVNDVVAIRGKVIIEEGAQVKGDAVSLGGKLHLQGKARVDGDAVALGGALLMDEGASVGGDKVSFALSINGTDLAQSFINKALEGSNCQINLGDDDE
jgi:UDP-3-O-[3-hydroxymyristoyl] glucosamine N-acyltransferase